MFKVSGMKSGVVWDAKTNRPLIHFKDGVGETDDRETAEKLKGLGFWIEGGLEITDLLANMKVKELLAFAESHGIALGSATTKADILAAIRAAKSE